MTSEAGGTPTAPAPQRGLPHSGEDARQAPPPWFEVEEREAEVAALEALSYRYE